MGWTLYLKAGKPEQLDLDDANAQKVDSALSKGTGRIRIELALSGKTVRYIIPTGNVASLVSYDAPAKPQVVGVRIE